MNYCIKKYCILDKNLCQTNQPQSAQQIYEEAEGHQCKKKLAAEAGRSSPRSLETVFHKEAVIPRHVMRIWLAIKSLGKNRKLQNVCGIVTEVSAGLQRHCKQFPERIRYLEMKVCI